MLHGIPHHPKVTDALIVGHDDHDIRSTDLHTPNIDRLAGFPQYFGEGYFVEVHVDAIGSLHVALHPGVHIAALRMTTGHQSGARGATDGMGVCLRETNTGSG